jgi:hypothetical protein
MTYVRKTQDEYDIEGYYTAEYGWEVVCTEHNMKDARAQIKLYRSNAPEYSYRIRKRRVKIENQERSST